ncbi:MAG: hypothetical protein RJA36_3541 [Pseudomonadota bacterium]|jgi:hypothetical protein
MKRSTAANLIAVIVAMFLVALILTPTLAHATGKPESPTPAPTSSTSSAASQAKAAIDLSLANSATGQGGAGGGGGSVSQGHTYVLPAPAAAAPLPAGMCPQGDSSAYSVLWGLVSWATSTTRTEMACLDKVLAVLKETAPKPVPAVVNYLHDLPVPPAAPASAAVAPVCEKAPEPVKPKAGKVAKAAPKKAGTCG